MCCWRTRYIHELMRWKSNRDEYGLNGYSRPGACESLDAAASICHWKGEIVHAHCSFKPSCFLMAATAVFLLDAPRILDYGAARLPPPANPPAPGPPWW